MSWERNRKGLIHLIPGAFPSLPPYLRIGPTQTLVWKVTISTGIISRHYVTIGQDIGMDDAICLRLRLVGDRPLRDIYGIAWPTSRIMNGYCGTQRATCLGHKVSRKLKEEKTLRDE